MRFKVDCYENPDAFSGLFFEREDKFLGSPLRLVAVLQLDSASAEDAADTAFMIGNDPSNPADAVGFKWPHRTVRSMSMGDVVVVRTPDGAVGYGCAAMGWVRLDPAALTIENPGAGELADLIRYA